MKQSSAFIIALAFSFAAKAQAKIDVTESAKHIGDSVTVCTKVFGVKQFDKITLINLGAQYPASPLTVAIDAKDRENFKDLAALKDKEVCVTGKIIEYKGKPEIIITTPEALRIQ